MVYISAKNRATKTKPFMRYKVDWNKGNLNFDEHRNVLLQQNSNQNLHNHFAPLSVITVSTHTAVNSINRQLDITFSGSWDSTSFLRRRRRKGRKTLCRRRMIKSVSSLFSSTCVQANNIKLLSQQKSGWYYASCPFVCVPASRIHSDIHYFILPRWTVFTGLDLTCSMVFMF